MTKVVDYGPVLLLARQSTGKRHWGARYSDLQDRVGRTPLPTDPVGGGKLCVRLRL